MNISRTVKQVAIIATALVTLTGGSGFSVYKWQQAEIDELKQTNAGQDILAGKDGHRLLDLEGKMMKLEGAVKALTDSVGVMNVTVNRMEVKIDFLIDGDSGY